MSSSASPVPAASQSAGVPGGGSTSLANSASLYLYTFLATLVLLLSVSGAIVIRSFVLRRRHRRMVEEAMRNGTWVPPIPATRPARVDLSKKPEIWEAYLGGGGWQAAGHDHGSGKEQGIGTNWNLEYSKDWDSMKPISAEPLSPAPPYAGPTPDTLSPPVPDPVPAPTTLLTLRGDEESQETPGIPTPPSLLRRARIFLNPPMPTLPFSTSPAAADNGTHPHSTNISMTELNSSSPSTVRVTVLIAMPSLSPHGSCTTPSCSLPSCSTTSHPLQSSSCPITNTSTSLPHLEIGVSEVLIGPAETPSTWNTERRAEAKASLSRGSSYAE